MAKYKIVGLPKKTEEYFELDLTPEEIEEYARGGFIIEDISVPSLSHAQEGGEPKNRKLRLRQGDYDPANEAGYIQETSDVNVADPTIWGKYGKKYEQDNSKADFVNRKKKQFLALHPGLNKREGVTMENFPANVEQNFRKEYDYKKHTAMVKGVSKEEGWNPRKRDTYVDDLNAQGKRIITDSKYGSKLQPSTWSRSLAGLQELGNTVLPGQPFKYKIPGLTKKEQKEMRDSKLSALEIFAPMNTLGQNIANYTKNVGLSTGSDYKELPGFLSGEFMPNVDDTDAMGLDPIQLPLMLSGIAELPNLAKSGATYLKNLGKSKKVDNLLYDMVENEGYKDLLEMDPSYAKNIDNEVSSGNKWLQEWVSHPETKKRMQATNFNADPAVQKNIDDFIANKNVVRGLVEDDFIGQGEFTGSQLGLYNPRTNKAYVDVMNPQFMSSNRKIPSTTVHEGVHIVGKGDLAYQDKNVNKLIQDAFAPDDFLYDLKKHASKRSNMLEPHEVHARVMQLRHQYDIKPGQQVDSKLIDKIIKDGSEGKTTVAKSFFNEIYNKKAFKDVFNTLPALTIGVGATELLTQKTGGEFQYRKGGEPKKKKRKTDDHGRYRSEDGNVRTPITPEMRAVMPPDEWGQYVQEVPEVYTTRTKEQQAAMNAARNIQLLNQLNYQRAPHLYLPDGSLRPQAAQAADWFWQLGMTGPAALKAAGSVLAKQIPKTGITYGTALNTAAGIHGATQVPQRIQDWQDVAEGKKDWREATAESLMTGLELYGGLSELRALKGIPRELPGSPNSFSIFPKKPIPLSERSLEFGKASKTVGGNQIPDNRWLPKPEPNPEYEWFNPENKKLYDEFTASLEEQAKRSQELSDFDAAAAMDKINASKLGPGAFEKLIMGDDLLWKTDDFAHTPRIPYTRKDMYREGNKLFPKVEYKPMDPITREQINVLNNIERSTNRLPEANQALIDIKALRTEMEPRDFVSQFRYELMDPKTSKPYTIEQIKRASPQQISSWRKQIERKLLNPIYTEIQLQGLLPKVKASDFKYYSNKEGGQISSSKNSKLSKFIS
jgi:hypothetical protein